MSDDNERFEGFEDDLEALARLGWQPDRIDQMAAMGLPAGALAHYLNLPADERKLVLSAMLGDPTTWDRLDAHPNGKEIAIFLTTLPMFQAGADADDEEFPDGAPGWMDRRDDVIKMLGIEIRSLQRLIALLSEEANETRALEDLLTLWRAVDNARYEVISRRVSDEHER